MVANVFFTSDLHFSHTRIREFQPNRAPLGSTIEEHDESLVRIWNETVGPKDTVYLLGDVLLDPRPEFANALLMRLNGHIKIAAGNHDTWIKRIEKKGLMPPHITVICDDKSMKRIRVGGKSMIVSHHPIEDWPGRASRPGRLAEDWRTGRWHLHGHSHGNSNFIPGRIDVGWDVHNKILSWEEVQEIIGAHQ